MPPTYSAGTMLNKPVETAGVNEIVNFCQSLVNKYEVLLDGLDEVDESVAPDYVSSVRAGHVQNLALELGQDTLALYRFQLDKRFSSGYYAAMILSASSYLRELRSVVNLYLSALKV